MFRGTPAYFMRVRVVKHRLKEKDSAEGERAAMILGPCGDHLQPDSRPPETPTVLEGGGGSAAVGWVSSARIWQ